MLEAKRRRVGHKSTEEGSVDTRTHANGFVTPSSSKDSDASSRKSDTRQARYRIQMTSGGAQSSNTTCKWCRAAFGTVGLLWTKVDGLQCDYCINVVAFFFKWASAAPQKKQLSDTIQQDEEKYEDFMAKREAWVKTRSEGGRVTAERVNQLGQAVQVIDVNTKTSVATSITEKLGNLWPVELYEANMEEDKQPMKVTKEMITTVKHKGRFVKGVLKPPSFGWADGCLEITVTSSDGCEIIEKATGSDAVADVGQLERAFDSLVRGQSVDVRAQQGQDGQEGNSCLKLKGEPASGGKVKQKLTDVDQEDEDSLLARLKCRRLVQSVEGAKPCGGISSASATARLSVASAGDGDDGNINTPRRLLGRGGAGSTKPLGLAGAVEPRISASTTSVPPSKRLREITGATPCVQEAHSYLGWLAENASFANCSTQQAKKILVNLEKRTSPSRAAAFLGGPVVGWEGDPMALLGEMRELIPKMTKVSSMMEVRAIQDMRHISQNWFPRALRDALDFE